MKKSKKIKHNNPKFTWQEKLFYTFLVLFYAFIGSVALINMVNGIIDRNGAAIITAIFQLLLGAFLIVIIIYACRQLIKKNKEINWKN
ncbi:MAG: hypothetical protein H6687_02905 [Bacillales bacterium]|nr:hypothetical protein [Bacillales bacterium]